ncbi:MAG: hypothetical protein ABH851_03850 [Methanobacteriota archaeon]
MAIDKEHIIKMVEESLPKFDFIMREDYEIGATFIFSDLANYTEKNKDNQKILPKIADIIQKSWDEGDEDIKNFVMVSYFEHLSDTTYKKISKYLDDKLRKISSDYIKSWKAFHNSK